MIIKMKWNEYRERWVLLDDNCKFIEELPDCRNVNAIFPHLRKEVVNKYELTQAVKTGEELHNG